MYVIDQYKQDGDVIVQNAGGPKTTDWINPTDGLAEDWVKVLNPTTSIVTGNGFIGNAQRVDAVSSSVSEAIRTTPFNIKPNTNYTFRLKYRSNGNSALRIFWNTGAPMVNLPINTGNAILFSTPVLSPATNVFLYLYVALSSQWFEVDEIEFIKI